MQETSGVGEYEIKMYVDKNKNGLIALYGGEYYSLTSENIKNFWGFVVHLLKIIKSYLQVGIIHCLYLTLQVFALLI
ncbi:prepilin [Escherichia coli DEC2E]|nr:prepilin [Escherichia coli DEC2E]